VNLEESPERLAAYRALALEYPRRFAELLEKAQAEAGVAGSRGSCRRGSGSTEGASRRWRAFPARGDADGGRVR
jgi:hypothetical protein